MMMISTLKAATRKRTCKVRSNSHTGQYAGSISPDHSQGQTLVEPLAFPPRVTRHINKFLRMTTQKRGSGLAIHTSGLNCHWLLVVIALEVMIFLAFCGLSFCGRKTDLSGRVFISQWPWAKVSTTVASHTRLRPLYQGPIVRPSGLLPSLVRPTGSKVEGRPMWVNDLLRMELILMAEWVPWEVACIFSTGEAMEPQLINNFATAASWAFKDFGTSSEGDCNAELIRTEPVSNTGNWIGNASDQARTLMLTPNPSPY